jgi:CheY-like chemotaxis protein
MAQPLALLFIDDSDADIELATRALQRSGIDAVWKVASSEPSLREVLGGWTPDLILSDFSMPTLTGPEALHLCRELAPAAPFVFFTGMLGARDLEKVAASGVSHVSKDRLEVLPAQVKRLVGKS